MLRIAIILKSWPKYRNTIESSHIFQFPTLVLVCVCVCVCQIENLQEQLHDKEKQLSSLKERVKSLQTDTSNTDTALTTLEEALAEKVTHTHTRRCVGAERIGKGWGF